jgi:hypothetical protein
MQSLRRQRVECTYRVEGDLFVADWNHAPLTVDAFEIVVNYRPCTVVKNRGNRPVTNSSDVVVARYGDGFSALFHLLLAHFLGSELNQVLL